MRKLLSYLLKQGVATIDAKSAPLDAGVRGLPKITDAPCAGSQCNVCQNVCPTNAITVKANGDQDVVSLDRGACISCGLCTAVCPTGTIVNDSQTGTARANRDELILTNVPVPSVVQQLPSSSIFGRSLAVRVVSTGCSACDLEIGAAGNPIFDMERFGVHVVASPRFADVLAVTGPVPKAMHEPLRRCYEAMAEPRRVCALGTCAISGGVHRGGYADANGVDNIIPVDIYIPGCPPHPWSIINGLQLAMGKHS